MIYVCDTMLKEEWRWHMFGTPCKQLDKISSVHHVKRKMKGFKCLGHPVKRRRIRLCMYGTPWKKEEWRLYMFEKVECRWFMFGKPFEHKNEDYILGTPFEQKNEDYICLRHPVKEANED